MAAAQYALLLEAEAEGAVEEEERYVVLLEERAVVAVVFSLTVKKTPATPKCKL